MASSMALFLVVVGVMISGTVASDADMLQDICVADLTSSVKLNGYPCKAANATAEDFFFAGISKPAVVNNSMGSVVTGVNVQKIPGLNTLGVSMSRIDYLPGGLNPPHTHPRASEIIFVINGELEVGFLTTANVLISKVVKEGEVFVFPRALVHFQKNNNADKPASVLSAFNSQNPGTQPLAAGLFGSNPPVPNYVLSKAFQIGNKQVDRIRAKLAPKK